MVPGTCLLPEAWSGWLELDPRCWEHSGGFTVFVTRTAGCVRKGLRVTAALPKPWAERSHT